MNISFLNSQAAKLASQNDGATSKFKQMLNKVPEITIYFWIIKILCTTVGETAADFLNTNLNLGLTGTSLIMGVLLIAVLFHQFKTKEYTPSIYWLAVVFISIVGTLITDNLTDNFGVSLEMTTIVFGVALAAIFAIWYAVERSLSIHSIITTRREAFYWLAVLFTFALGTAAGDLTAEKFGLGYLTSLFIFAGFIVIITSAHYIVKEVLAAEHRHQSTNAVLAFWLVYILTRPLGASIGDYLSQSPDDGGLGFGTTATSALFLVAILAVVVHLTLTREDEISLEVVKADVSEQCAREGCGNAAGETEHHPFCSQLCAELVKADLAQKDKKNMNKKVISVIILTIIALVLVYLYSFGPLAKTRLSYSINQQSAKPVTEKANLNNQQVSFNRIIEILLLAI